MTAAFWIQLGVAGLLVVLSLLDVAIATYAVGTELLVYSAVPLVLSAWLVGAAAGLRRGSRAAHRLSLAGLVLPLLLVLAGGAFDVGQTDYAVFLTGADAGPDPVAQALSMIGWSMVSGAVSAGASLAAIVLAAAAAGMLLTRAARRYFARAVD